MKERFDSILVRSERAAAEVKSSIRTLRNAEVDDEDVDALNQFTDVTNEILRIVKNMTDMSLRIALNYDDLRSPSQKITDSARSAMSTFSNRAAEGLEFYLDTLVSEFLLAVANQDSDAMYELSKYVDRTALSVYETDQQKLKKIDTTMKSAISRQQRS